MSAIHPPRAIRGAANRINSAFTKRRTMLAVRRRLAVCNALVTATVATWATMICRLLPKLTDEHGAAVPAVEDGPP